MERKTCEVELFGRKVLLAERSYEVEKAMTDSLEKDPALKESEALYVCLLEAGLSVNRKWWRFWDNYKYKYKYLIKKCSSTRIAELAFQVLILEGQSRDELTGKKKIAENQSQEDTSKG
jgi:hypothetical protein